MCEIGRKWYLINVFFNSPTPGLNQCQKILSSQLEKVLLNWSNESNKERIYQPLFECRQTVIGQIRLKTVSLYKKKNSRHERLQYVFSLQRPPIVPMIFHIEWEKRRYGKAIILGAHKKFRIGSHFQKMDSLWLSRSAGSFGSESSGLGVSCFWNTNFSLTKLRNSQHVWETTKIV